MIDKLTKNNITIEYSMFFFVKYFFILFHQKYYIICYNCFGDIVNKYIKIMRVDHWIKQLFILPGFVCALYLGHYKLDIKIIVLLLIGFLTTNMIASANYVINEYLDREYDKYHPEKKKRILVNNDINGKIIFLMWLLLGLLGLIIGYYVFGIYFFIVELSLLIMGLLYNVKPFRTKDIFILDVLTESINNVIRFLLGWFISPINIIIPISILLGYWMIGAYLMTIKRYSEYIMINNSKKASSYRKSFKYYNEKNLLVLALFYAMMSVFFVGIFLIKYRIELILFIPFFIALFCYYFYLSFDKDSSVQKPEKLYNERGLMVYLLFLMVLFVALMNIDIKWLDIFLI